MIWILLLAVLSPVAMSGVSAQQTTRTGMDFHGQNLATQSFKRQDLRNADFTNAVLRGTDFTGADLRGERFDGADSHSAASVFTRLDMRTAPLIAK